MAEKVKNRILCVGMLVFLLGMGVWLLCRTPDAYSKSERRTLTQRSAIQFKKVWDGSFMKEAENYGLDQFPLRDGFRKIKAEMEYKVFLKKDNNGIYQAEGQLSKIEYPLLERGVKGSLDQMQQIYEWYLQPKGIRPYLVVVPDKNYYLAEKNNILSMDYDSLYEKMKKGADHAEWIEIRDLLEAGDYYATDSHWRQEKIVDVAERIAAGMGTELDTSLEQTRLQTPFYGVWSGQYGLSVEPDELCYLTSDTLENAVVTILDTGAPVEKPMYDLKKAEGKDPYELFLNGAKAILTIENENAKGNRELLLFRDSFGSSLAPLMVSGYRKITLIDTRYVNSSVLGEYVEFQKTDQDVLFLYSTLMLNHGLGKAN